MEQIHKLGAYRVRAANCNRRKERSAMLTFCMAVLIAPEDTSDFESIYKSYKSRMLGLAYKVLGNYHDAEEAVSQAFLSVASSFGKVKGRSLPEQEAYIAIVTKNAALDIYRKNKRDNSVAFDEIENLSEVSDDVSDEVLANIGYERIIGAIKALPDIYAESLYLYHVNGLSVKEIAKSLKQSEANIKKRLERARKKLSLLLEDNNG